MFKVDASRIRALVFDRELTITEFAKAAKINRITAAKVLRDGTTVNGKTIVALAKFFGVTGNEIIVKED